MAIITLLITGFFLILNYRKHITGTQKGPSEKNCIPICQRENKDRLYLTEISDGYKNGVFSFLSPIRVPFL